MKFKVSHGNKVDPPKKGIWSCHWSNEDYKRSYEDYTGIVRKNLRYKIAGNY